jgi:hypothetical protein
MIQTRRAGGPMRIGESERGCWGSKEIEIEIEIGMRIEEEIFFIKKKADMWGVEERREGISRGVWCLRFGLFLVSDDGE